MLQFLKKAVQKEKGGKEGFSVSSPTKSNAPGSPTLSNGSISLKSLECPDVQDGLLSRFHDEELVVGDLGDSEGSPVSIPKVATKSRLSKTLPEVLSDKGALGYFIQYMEAHDAVALIKLWLDVESFRAASQARIRTNTSGKLACVPVTSEELESGTSLRNCTSSTHHNFDNISLETDSDSCAGEAGIVSESPLHINIKEGMCNNDSLSVCGESNKNIVHTCSTNTSVVQCTNAVTSSHSIKVVHSLDCDSVCCVYKCNQSSTTKENCDDINSRTNYLCNHLSNVSSVLDHKESDNRKLCESVSIPNVHVEEQLISPSRANKLIQATLDDAVRIFKKYIASNAPYRVKMPCEIRNKIIDSICKEDGLVDSECFSECQALVFHIMDKDYLNDFLRSDFHCKHQIDVLTSGTVFLSDILYNETALFYFMEFMEQEGGRSLLEFWIAAENFQQHLLEKQGTYDVTEAQSDAIILYDKYFSLQATCPLGFNDKVRLEIEQNICREGGPIPDCFKWPVSIVLHYLEKNLLTQFLTSQLYFKYLSELINTIQASPGLLSSKSKNSGSECSSGLNISIQNTLLAMEDSAAPPRKIIRNVDEREMSIDSRQLYDPDSLWKRKHQSDLSFGRINSLGRFERDVELEPGKKEESRLTKVVKKLVNMEEDKAKEEMAWQVAEMIVKDITNLTMGSDDEQI